MTKEEYVPWWYFEPYGILAGIVVAVFMIDLYMLILDIWSWLALAIVVEVFCVLIIYSYSKEHPRKDSGLPAVMRI